MTAKEIREYRTISKKLVEVEEKNKLLEELKRRKVCLGEEEMFITSLQNKFKCLGSREGQTKKQHEDIEGGQTHCEKQGEIQQESSRSVSMAAIPGFGDREKILTQVVVAQRENRL